MEDSKYEPRLEEKSVDKELKTKEYVRLPNVLAEEFGIAVNLVEDCMLNGKLEVDGKRWNGEPHNFDVEQSSIDGKTFKLKEQNRVFQIVYRSRDPYSRR